MSLEQVVIWVVIGAVAGLLANAVVGGIKSGLWGAIIVGILGAFLGGWLLSKFGFNPGGGIIGEAITAFIGAIVLLLLLNLLKKL
ncbi:MAG TPA: GlsB/YeaQ/YmgE family stress response membrane protein [Anaerolineales bacterium]|jgi:uncharacterized membrane protein YeaQ/YmgE (transglycosylase-associated protein family)|nr:GlsB/YeaQ/YmgE family stress response membrane protein [Anaerolineales bacterium]